VRKKNSELRREERWEYRGKNEREAGGSNGGPGWKKQKYENISLRKQKKRKKKSGKKK